jgi:hypothetical protein
VTKKPKVMKAVALSAPPEPGRSRSMDEAAEWLRFRASITACLWRAIAESEFTPEDLAADTGISEDKIKRMLSGDHEDSTTAELAALFYVMGFALKATLTEPESIHD